MLKRYVFIDVKVIRHDINKWFAVSTLACLINEHACLTLFTLLKVISLFSRSFFRTFCPYDRLLGGLVNKEGQSFTYKVT